MFSILVVLCFIASINGQLPVPAEQHPAPEPYSFAYTSPNDDGTFNAREETGDADGRVTGFYTLLGADGQQRRVEYVADENGFRANIVTNEIGTESQNPADVQFLSQAPTAAELNTQWEAANPRPRPAPVPIARPVGPIAGPAFAGPAIQAFPRQPIAGPGIVGPGPVPRPPIGAIRGPVGPVQGPGLIAAPIGSIGGGISGGQGLRIGQGVGPGPVGPLPGPISNGAGVGVIRVNPFGGQINGGFIRNQGINPLGGGIGFTNGGYGVVPNGLGVGGGAQGQWGLVPIGLNGQQGWGGFGGAPWTNQQQNLQGFRAVPVNQWGNGNGNGQWGNGQWGNGGLILVPAGAGAGFNVNDGNGNLQDLSGASNDNQQRPITSESNRNEGYGRKI